MRKYKRIRDIDTGRFVALKRTKRRHYVVVESYKVNRHGPID